jgi:DNA-directed RNA polymerase specialized sigma subunit, sigma24 homolog
MANSIRAKVTGFAAIMPKVAAGKLEEYQKVYESNRNRVYSFAFWMTDNEMAAEEVSASTFRRAFAHSEAPSEELIDRMLLAEVRELMPVGVLSLSCAVSTEIESIRHNVKRVHLERAVVQLPSTERFIFVMHDGEGYSHERIARTLGISSEESQNGLHQARLRIRELVADMK